jgi:beta-lactamase superfamily II metal-dependent hydrolase
MTAHFIDVGQAHSTLLEFSCGAMLIDAGTKDDEHEEELLEYLDEFFDRRTDLDRTLDSILITHDHLDHTRSGSGRLVRMAGSSPPSRSAIRGNWRLIFFRNT